MGKNKVCVDIGGTKTIFAVLNSRLQIKYNKYIATPKGINEFIEMLDLNLNILKNESKIVNVSIAGRIDANGKVLFAPNLPIMGINIKSYFKKYFKKVHIDNDANCFAVYELFRGHLKNKNDGVVIVWGTGVGGALVLQKRIYRGRGLASEMGHIKVMTEPGTDVENLIGGKWLNERFTHPGIKLNELASTGDLSALKAFEDIGKIFGRYLSSITYLLDPEIVVLGGSFIKSWKFIRPSVEATIKAETIRKKLTIKTVNDEFYVIKGCYFLDEYEDVSNKL